jgi:excisionase family DNA binding protein
MKELLTVKQAAQILGVSIEVMRRLVWSNSIDYIDLNKGGKYIQARFTRKHLEDFMARNEVKAG